MSFGVWPGYVLRGLAGLQEEFLEHEAGQAGRRIQGGQAEGRVGQDQQRVERLFHAGEAGDLGDHGGDTAGENIRDTGRVTRGAGIGDGADGDDGQHAFKERTWCRTIRGNGTRKWRRRPRS